MSSNPVADLAGGAGRAAAGGGTCAGREAGAGRRGGTLEAALGAMLEAICGGALL